MHNLVQDVFMHMEKQGLLDDEKADYHLIILKAYTAMSLFTKHDSGEKLVYDFRTQIARHLCFTEEFLRITDALSPRSLSLCC